jgi:hypothetical protein
MNAKPDNGSEKKRSRDWFGYVVTGVVGLVITIGATWYQLYATERQATAAEQERARAVRQSVIAIVEEQVLNGKKLEADRITRLIDLRRREQSVSLGVSTVDVVQQAEFNIASSSYLNVQRKEEVKSVFDAFYREEASKSFQAFPPGTPNADLLNELAKNIQEGKSTAALAVLKRLEELYANELAKLTKESRPSVFAALIEFFRRPLNVIAFVFVYLAAILGFALVKRRLSYARSSFR